MSILSKNKALFLDRDGTLIVDKGYLCNPDDVELLPYVCESLRFFQKEQWIFFLFSNQSGVGRGYYSLEQAQLCNQKLLQLLGLGEQFFQKICLATETPEQVPIYRKPSPRFILECIEEFNLDRHQCWMIGDKLSDVQAGLRARIQVALLTTQLDACSRAVCVKDLNQFKRWMIRHNKL